MTYVLNHAGVFPWTATTVIARDETEIATVVSTVDDSRNPEVRLEHSDDLGYLWTVNVAYLPTIPNEQRVSYTHRRFANHCLPGERVGATDVLGRRIELPKDHLKIVDEVLMALGATPPTR